MSVPQAVSRRDFLYLAALNVGGFVLSACAPETMNPEPVLEQDLPTQTVPAAAVGDVPTAIPTVAGTPTPVPTATPRREPPMLAEQVASGELPSLAERLPKNPLTLQPVNTIGRYGGRLRLTQSWQGYIEEYMYGDSPVRWVDDAQGVAPGMCDSWEANADNTVWRLHIREGLRWSDGHPVTTADILFWWQEMVLDPEYPDYLPPFAKVGDVMADFVALDDYTLELRYPSPAPLTIKQLAMFVNGGFGPRWIIPKHYVQQFHPRYNPDYKDYDVFNQKIFMRNNPECPTLTAWRMVEIEPNKFSIWERNPYYYCVDTEGNQLPYIDFIDDTFSQNPEFFQSRLFQGSVDFSYFTDASLADVANFVSKGESGNYEVQFWDSGSGTGIMCYWNHDCPDERKRALNRTPQYKQAISHALDRPTIQRVVYYDTGYQTTGTLSPKAIEFNYNAEAQAHFQKFRDSYVAYDPEKAMRLLDEIGVVDVDGDGWREYPDGTKLVVRIDLEANPGSGVTKVLEIAEKNWQEVGLNTVINQMTNADFQASREAGTLEFTLGFEVGDGPDHLLFPAWVVPTDSIHWAPLCGGLYIVRGSGVENTELDLSPWDRNPPRFHKDEPEYKNTPFERLHQLYDQAVVEVDPVKRMHLVWEMNEVHMNEGPFFIGTVANYPRIIIVGNNLENVPTREQLKLGGFCHPWAVPYPAITNPETYSFKDV